MSETSQIAEMLKISLHEASAYCEEVRAISKLGNGLPYRKIALCLQMHIDESPSAQRLATFLQRMQWEVSPNKKAYRPHNQKRWKVSKAIKSQKRYQAKASDKSVSFPKDLVHNSVYDQDRLRECFKRSRIRLGNGHIHPNLPD